MLALLASALLGVGVGACGGAARTASSSSPGVGSSAAATTGTTPIAGGYLKQDGDKDSDDGAYAAHPGQDDEGFLATYGRKARPAEARTIAALVRRYYAASLTEDGAGACALLSPSLVAGLVATQGQSSRGAGACAAAIAPLLAQQHGHLLAEEPATMVVTGVYLKSDLGVAVLGFRHAPESTILLSREDQAWRIDALFDNLMA